jgi:hypothetical protein
MHNGSHHVPAHQLNLSSYIIGKGLRNSGQFLEQSQSFILRDLGDDPPRIMNLHWKHSCFDPQQIIRCAGPSQGEQVID